MSLNPADTLVTIRAQYTPVYGRGQANTAAIDFERAGAAVTPSAVLYTLNGETGTAIVDAAAATVASGTASYALTSSHLASTAELSAGYLERWAITYADGTVQTYERTVIVGRRSLSPPIGQTDIEQRLPNLARQRSGNPQVTDYQGYITQAWEEIVGDLVALGVLPNRIVQPSALRMPHMFLTLTLIFESFAMGQGERGNWLEMARMYRERYERAWSAATAQMDQDDDGVPDDEGRLRSGLRSPVLLTEAAPTFIGPRWARSQGW